MNRSEKRREKKLSKKSTIKSKPVLPKGTPPQQTFSIQEAINLAVKFHSAGDFIKAEEIYSQILAQDPNQPAALHFSGVIAHQANENEMAVELISKALAIKPDYAEAYNNLGTALKELDRLEEAADNYRKAIDLKPDYADAFYNLGSVYEVLYKYDLAIACYHKTLAIQPDYIKAHWNLSDIFLQRGDLKRGWQEYEWGLHLVEARGVGISRSWPCAVWQGEPLQGKNIFVYPEQGIGDEILFSGCITDLLSLSPNQIYLECEPRLEPLFARSFPSVRVCGKAKNQDCTWVGEGVDLDYYVPIGSLLKFFRNNQDDFPNRDSFLIPDTEKQASIRADYIHRWPNKTLVGVAWHSGNKKIGSIRSLSLDEMQPILSHADCQFISLQYGNVENELSVLKENLGIDIFFDPEIDALQNMDTFSAQIAALDLVISIDNSTAHVAGSIGVPTWVLLNSHATWRWLSENDTSLWYRSAHVYRQKTLGVWDDVIEQVSKDLKSKYE